MMSERVNLKPGEIVSAQKPVIVRAELDSSICVCLFTDDGRGGGILHYANNGEALIHKLVNDLCNLLGGLSKQLKAKIVGGSGALGTGQVNVDTAKKTLGRLQVSIVAEDTGGSSSREIIFNVLTGRLQVAYLDQKPKTIEHSKTPVVKNKVRVLIVDDFKTIRDLLVKVLSEDPKIEIVGEAEDPSDQAENGKEALELLKVKDYHVVLSDIKMPTMGGLELFETALKFNIFTPFIFLTGHSDQEMIIKALRLGAIDFLGKPFLPLELSNVILRTIELGQRRLELMGQIKRPPS
jgi:hypothetical protein